MSPRDGKLILVADDDDDVRDLVAFRLKRAGFAVIEAGDGREALEAARERRPDLCLLDVMMPSLDGYEVTRELRASAGLERVPVVLLTASVQDAAVSKGFEAGADDYIKKPFSPQELLARVSSMLDAG
ncbi:MAG: response regulator [Solirubrobacterales bacterium]|nr:response regulator [Solirubrobacterales bacterium]